MCMAPEDIEGTKKLLNGEKKMNAEEKTNVCEQLQGEELIKAVDATRRLREKYLADVTRPGYHFAIPDDFGVPGDVNCCFYARGRYHLMYLYACRRDGFRYGHLSSTDLVHWRSHPDALMPDELDGGIFSGGAFVDDDGTCYMSFWALPKKEGGWGGVRLAKSSDRNYEVWEKFEDYVLECTESGMHETVDAEGKPLYLGCADPSNIWKKDGKYYMQHGNLPVLLKFRMSGMVENEKRDPSTFHEVPDEVRGDWVDLFESDDLHNWRYLHRFYERKADNSWTNWDEDDMCPVFLPLPAAEDGGKESGKYLQLFISHNKGCQYYIGEYDKAADKFYPETHGRMTWKDNTFFAPEALQIPDGRTVMWAWLLDNLYPGRGDLEKLGWSGVFGLPRSLWLRKDGSLGMAPIKELKNLRYNETQDLGSLDPVSCEIKLEFTVEAGSKSGMYVYKSPDGSEYTKIYYDEAAKELVMDLEHSGNGPRNIVERAPLSIAPGKTLKLDIFLDKAVVEVFANKRQAICRRVYTTRTDSTGMEVIAEGSSLKAVKAWDMMPSNMY